MLKYKCSNKTLTRKVSSMKNSIQHFSEDGIKNLEKAEENLAMHPDDMAALPGLFLKVM